eukprot:Pgem_evm1s3802
MQLLHNPADQTIKVIECNLRASRSFPFVSKTMNSNLIEKATSLMIEKKFGHQQVNNHLVDHNDNPKYDDLMNRDIDYHGVKVAQFAFTRLGGADPKLGVEMSSTGEVACFGKTVHDAYLKAMESVHGFSLPNKGCVLLMDHLTDTSELEHVAMQISKLGLQIFTENDAFELLKDKNISLLKKLPTDLGKVKGLYLAKEEVDLVIDMSGLKPKTQTHLYHIRRLAVNHGVSLINNSKCAVMFADAMIERQTLTSLRDITHDSTTYTKSWNGTTTTTTTEEEQKLKQLQQLQQQLQKQQVVQQRCHNTPLKQMAMMHTLVSSKTSNKKI